MPLVAVLLVSSGALAWGLSSLTDELKKLIGTTAKWAAVLGGGYIVYKKLM